MVWGTLQTEHEQCWELDIHSVRWSGKQHGTDSVTNMEHFMSQSWARVDQSLCDVFFNCDAYKKHKDEVWRRWKILPTSLFIGPFIMFIEITSHPCLSVCPCVFLWIRCSPTLTFSFANAERICLKESQAEGNLYLAGRLDVLFGSVWELCFRSLQSLLNAYRESDLQNPLSSWLPGKAELRNGLGLSQHCLAPSKKTILGAGLWKRSSI